MFKKYKKRILKYICTFMCVFIFSFCFSVKSYAVTAYYPQYDYNLPNIAFRCLGTNNAYTSVVFQDIVSNGQNAYSVTNFPRTTFFDEWLFYSNGSNVNIPTWTFPYLEDYDYYFSSTYFVNDESLSFTIEDFKLLYCRSSEMYEHTLSNKQIIPYSVDSRHGFTMICKIDSISADTGLYGHRVIYPSTTLALKGAMYYTACVFVVPKGDVEAVNNIVEAINQQNNLIESGTSDTQSAVDNFTSVFEDFNQELENWEQFDDEIIGEFDEANTGYMNELSNFSLSGSLLNAGNWLSTSMQTVYDNSSDYKMLWLVPLLFGIPILLFIIRKNGDDE